MSEVTSPERVINVRTFWQAVGLRAVGTAIVTAEGNDGPRGFLALSATHLCAEPPILMISVDKKTSAVSAILEGNHFAINYLSSGQSALADIFGGKSELTGADRFTTMTWETLATGAPVLLDAVGVIDCQVVETIERDNVVLIIGRVVATHNNPQAVPLVHFRGGYLR